MAQFNIHLKRGSSTFCGVTSGEATNWTTDVNACTCAACLKAVLHEKVPVTRTGRRPHPMIESDAEQTYYALFVNRAQHTGLNHLRWIYWRFIAVHGGNPNADYMHTLKDIIRDLEVIETRLGQKPTHGTDIP